MGEVILYISKWKEQPAFDMKLAGIRRYADKCGLPIGSPVADYAMRFLPDWTLYGAQFML